MMSSLHEILKKNQISNVSCGLIFNFSRTVLNTFTVQMFNLLYYIMSS